MLSKQTISFANIEGIIDSFNGTIINKDKSVDDLKIASINAATQTSLVFIDKNARNKDKLISETPACTIICDDVPDDETVYKDKCLIVVNNPKLFFAKLVSQQLSKFTPQVHPTAIISASANIAESCYIGAHVVIGENVEIGENTFIHSNCSIYDNVKIGRNVIIDAGCVIGAAGFGFVRDEITGEPTRFPQLGGVIIEDDVEIGANTCIDRGALQDTIIRKGVKIDNLVHIGHNIEIDEYSYIITHTAIGGSTKIGKRCWIATSDIMNKITIGDDVTIGLGAVVVDSVPSGATYLGNPAMNIRDYAKMQYYLKKLPQRTGTPQIF